MKNEDFTKIDLKPSTTNFLHFDYKKLDNEFVVRYLSIELSISDSTQENYILPEIQIIPIIIGRDSPSQKTEQTTLSKLINDLTKMKAKGKPYEEIPNVLMYSSPSKEIFFEYISEKGESESLLKSHNQNKPNRFWTMSQ